MSGLELLGQSATQVAAAVGLDQFPWVDNFPWTVANGAATWFTANAAQLTRVRVSKAITITQMTFEISVASGNVDLGIYTYSAGTYTRIASTGSTAASGSNAVQTIALTGSVTLSPGVDYAFAMAADNTTLSISRALPRSAVAGNNSVSMLKTTSFPLPTSIASASVSNYVPWLRAS